MNKIDFAGKRNFAFSTDVGDFMQVGMQLVEKIAALGGDNYILKGCEPESAGSNVITDGIMVLNGMVVPFKRGTKQTYIKLVETKDTIVLGSLTRDETSYHAEFGTTSVPGYQFAWDAINGNRLDNLLSITNRVAATESNLQAIINVKNEDVGITNSIDSIETIYYSKINISTTMVSISFRFSFVVPAIMSNPEFEFDISFTSPDVGMTAVGWNNAIGFCRFKIVHTTPLTIQCLSDFTPGAYILELTTTIPL